MLINKFFMSYGISDKVEIIYLEYGRNWKNLFYYFIVNLFNFNIKISKSFLIF